MENKEQLVRVAKLFGNGAHIFVPKEWIGERLIIIKPQKKTLKEKIIEVLDPYLESIVGVYLYGSHARLEQIENSDIDLLIITDKKIKIKKEGFEIICLEQKDIPHAIMLEPLLLYSIFSEAKALINSKLLEELKVKYIPNLNDFIEYLEDCKRIIKVNEEFLESEKGKYLSSEAIIYSLVLRLRGLFILKSILKGEKYTHKLFKLWIKNKIKILDFNSIFEVYRSSKMNKKISSKIKVEDIIKLLDLLRKEISIKEYG